MRYIISPLLASEEGFLYFTQPRTAILIQYYYSGQDARTTNYQLPITNYLLPITYYQLPITYSAVLLAARLARASAESMTSAKFSTTSPGKFSKTLVEIATRPLPSSKSIITALIG